MAQQHAAASTPVRQGVEPWGARFLRNKLCAVPPHHVPAAPIGRVAARRVVARLSSGPATCSWHTPQPSPQKNTPQKRIDSRLAIHNTHPHILWRNRQIVNQCSIVSHDVKHTRNSQSHTYLMQKSTLVLRQVDFMLPGPSLPGVLLDTYATSTTRTHRETSTHIHPPNIHHPTSTPLIQHPPRNMHPRHIHHATSTHHHPRNIHPHLHASPPTPPRNTHPRHHATSTT